MQCHNAPKVLNEEQQQLLDKFIESFLPKRGNKRKNSGNELDYVSNTLDKLFKREFGLISHAQMSATLLSNWVTIYSQKMENGITI